MTHDSFEDDTTAKLMIELFVNIKVDREERRDLNSIVVEDRSTGKMKEWKYAGVFVFIGLKPNHDREKGKADLDARCLRCAVNKRVTVTMKNARSFLIGRCVLLTPDRTCGRYVMKAMSQSRIAYSA